MKKILVPIDLSDNSNAILKYASRISGILRAKVYIFHVSELPDFYVSDLEDYNLYEKEFKAALKKIHSASFSVLQDLKKRNFEEPANIICKAVLSKSIYRGILDYAIEVQPDLIIMGKGSEESKTDIKIGSNTERILRLTGVPLLVVNRDSEKFSVKKFVFASDFRSDAVKVFRRALETINTEHVSVRLLYVNTKSKFEEYDEVKSRIDKFKKSFTGDLSVVIRAGRSIESTITRYAESISADLVIIGVSRKKGIAHLFLNRVAENVIAESSIPVLAVKGR